MPLYFKAKVDGVRGHTRLVSLPQRTYRAVFKAFRDIGLQFLRRFKTENLAGRPGLNKRTGELAKSFQMSLEGSVLQTTRLKIFSHAPQARLQEYGGTVRPVNAQYLAIPLPAAMTRAGVARGSPRDFQNTFFAVSKAGNLILFQSLGKNAKTGKRKFKKYVNADGIKEKSNIVPLFVMKKEVYVPPRLGMRALWQDMKEERSAFLKAALAPVLKTRG